MFEKLERGLFMCFFICHSGSYRYFLEKDLGFKRGADPVYQTGGGGENCTG